MNLFQALRSPLRTARNMRSIGVLGMNERNQHYTTGFNPRKLYPIVDDKLQTKELCEREGIPTAKLHAVARYNADIGKMLDEVDTLDSFVLKPARGAMGNGILVVRERREGLYVRAGGQAIDREAVSHHASSILSGMFALGGKPDVAFIEERLIVHPELAKLSVDGVPDLRFVVFRGVPVMAMTRLPTSSSGGRANLHQGAVGAGIDLASGRTVHAVVDGAMVEKHPDTGESLLGVRLPDYEKALRISVQATSATGLGYVGADVVVDAAKGALILELNARPGLAIQIANQAGLAPRLQAVEAIANVEKLPLEERIAFGREVASRVPAAMHEGSPN